MAMTEILLALMLASTLASSDHVCVPSPEGRWLCGDQATPPSPAGLPPLPARRGDRTAPPVLLIDPRLLDFSDADAAGRPSNQAQASSKASSEASSEARSQPSSQASAQASALGKPEPAKAAQVAPKPSVPRPSAALPPTVRRDAPTTAPMALGDARINPREERDKALAARHRMGAAFSGSGLPSGAGYIVQLALARSLQGFPSLLKQLGRAGSSAQTWRVSRNGELWYVLGLGPYQTLALARSAIPAQAKGAFARPLADLRR